ncbi:hypothetical protein [Sandaracinus amylolyticus]|uniref:hypothetical protein n=1 Tax=Sandaracinus amylolyticus TaxID=927083 RepID=UPI001F48F2CA|nr:hypothetical protein [Sandaracinus amylolyticus]UJR80506.1 Hypothetical protein I5071_25530 [Sandaracinus amylolyticus]
MEPRLVVVAAVAAAGLLPGCVSGPRARIVGEPVPSRSSELLAETLASASEPIHRCIGGARSGTLRALLVFAPHGLVASVQLPDWQAPTDDVEMRSCVADVLYGLELPPFDGKELHVDVAYDLR